MRGAEGKEQVGQVGKKSKLGKGRGGKGLEGASWVREWRKKSKLRKRTTWASGGKRASWERAGGSKGEGSG